MPGEAAPDAAGHAAGRAVSRWTSPEGTRSQKAAGLGPGIKHAIQLKRDTPITCPKGIDLRTESRIVHHVFFSFHGVAFAEAGPIRNSIPTVLYNLDAPSTYTSSLRPQGK